MLSSLYITLRPPTTITHPTLSLHRLYTIRYSMARVVHEAQHNITNTILVVEVVGNINGLMNILEARQELTRCIKAGRRLFISSASPSPPTVKNILTTAMVATKIEVSVSQSP